MPLPFLTFKKAARFWAAFFQFEILRTLGLQIKLALELRPVAKIFGQTRLPKATQKSRPYSSACSKISSLDSAAGRYTRKPSFCSRAPVIRKESPELSSVTR